MKFKIAVVLEEAVFDFIYYESNYAESNKIKNLINKDNIYIYNETNDRIYFKIPTNQFFRQYKYVEIMSLIFSYEQQLEIDKSAKPFIKRIKSYLQKIENRNQIIFDLFLKTMQGHQQQKIVCDNILKIEPYDFQSEQAWQCFTMKRIANFSSPGSGKTLTSMIAVLKEYIDHSINNLVVIGPKSARYAWLNKKEIKNFYKNNYRIKTFDFSDYINKKEKISDIARNYQDGDTLNIIFINYHKLQTETGWYESLISIFKNPTGLIVDECHYFKNKDSQKFKKLMNLSMQAYYVYFLSGTPLPHSLKEGFYLTYGLWPLLDKNKRNTIIEKIPFEKEDFTIDNFKKIYVRQNKEEHIEPLFIEKIEIQQNIVEEFIDNKLREILHSNELNTIFNHKINRAILIRRMQAASSPHSLKMTLRESIDEMFEDESQSDDNFSDTESSDAFLNIDNSKDIEKKIEKIIQSSEIQKILYEYQEDKDPRFIELFNLLEKLQEQRIIIWNVFRKSSQQLVNFLNKKYAFTRIICKVDGSITSDYERTFAINKIRKSTNGILIASPATIAESISLHKEIDYAIYFFRNYVGSHWMQSIDRIHRLVGVNEKSRKKYVYLLISKNRSLIKDSIDELIDINLEKKIKEQSEFLD